MVVVLVFVGYQVRNSRHQEAQHVHSLIWGHHGYHGTMSYRCAGGGMKTLLNNPQPFLPVILSSDTDRRKSEHHLACTIASVPVCLNALWCLSLLAIQRFLEWSTLCVHVLAFFVRVFRMWRILIRHEDKMWHSG